ncbi:hypothetical protein [Bordetella genomosp. 11]|nr:hypothetical protein [Bordetella genomosp. 11]
MTFDEVAAVPAHPTIMISVTNLGEIQRPHMQAHSQACLSDGRTLR